MSPESESLSMPLQLAADPLVVDPEFQGRLALPVNLPITDLIRLIIENTSWLAGWPTGHCWWNLYVYFWVLSSAVVSLASIYSESPAWAFVRRYSAAYLLVAMAALGALYTPILYFLAYCAGCAIFWKIIRKILRWNGKA